MSGYPDITRRPSLWEARHWPAAAAPLDVAVLGGGLVGLQAALYLAGARPGLRVAMVERSDPPAGASTRNAGFACVGSLGELADDVAQIGLEATVELVLRRARGLALLERALGGTGVEIDWCGNVECFRPGEEAALRRARALLPQMNAALAGPIRRAGPVFTEVPDFAGATGIECLGAIRNALEGQLDPGAAVRALQDRLRAAGGQLLLDRVVELTPREGGGAHVSCDGYELAARAVVLAGNGFVRHWRGAQQWAAVRAIRPALNQVIVTEPLDGPTWTTPIHLDRGYGYARRVGRRILVGGFRPLAGAAAETSAFGLSPKLSEHLRAVLAELAPAAVKARSTRPAPRIEYEWSGVLGLGADRSPRAASLAPGVVLAAGLGGMGVALSGLLAREAAELVLSELPSP